MNVDTPASLSKEWVAHIWDTIAKLHDLEIIWVDAKGESVLIEKEIRLLLLI